ncbi:MAG: hypothetical protein PHV91_09350, partial [Bacteroidales bacterium]|nr:hypothetical protein [Bacteroidales bacterium]
MKKHIKLTLFLLIMASVASAQTKWIEDSNMNYKIQVPANYQTNEFWEGSDKILALLSPDQNVAIRIRSFKVNNNVSKEQVIKTFSQNIIKGATQLVNQNHNLNGMDGGLAGFRWKYNNINVIVAAFYTIQNGTAYIVWTLIPENLFASRNAESDAITNTFTVTYNQQQTAQTTNRVNPPQTTNSTTNTAPDATPIHRTPLDSKPNPLMVTNIALGTGINNTLTITSPKETIDPAQKTIHLVATHNGRDNGKNFIVKWYSITQQCLVAENEYKPKTKGLNKVHSTIENIAGNWPTGEYRAEIWHMG